MHQLRPYQIKAKKAVENAWKQGKRAPLLRMPTGSGKTTVVAHIVKDYPSNKGLFLCPARELVLQGVERFREHNIPAGVLMGSQKPKEDETVHVATIQTAIRRDLDNYSVVVVDEAHHAIAKQCKQLLDKYNNSKIVGITATPIRMDGKGLGQIFDVILDPISLEDLIKQNYLVPLKVFAPKVPVDLSKVKIDRKKRDFSPRSLMKTYATPALVGDAITHWKRHAEHKPTFIYCCSVAHANSVMEDFRQAGVKTDVITGKTPKGKRAELFEAMKNGDLTALCNVGVLTEGVDFPRLGSIVLLRPTLSKALHFQIIGRGHRKAPNKTYCIVLDHADNFRRHGFPEAPQEWSLKGSKQTTKAMRTVKNPQTWQCQHCGALMPIGTKRCPNCRRDILPLVGKGELQEVKRHRWRVFW